MKIVWIGSINWFFADTGYLFPPKYAGEMSGSAFEQAIIEGLESLGNDVTIINDKGMQAQKEFKWSHNGKSEDICVDSIAQKYVRLIHKQFSLKHAILKVKNTIEDADAVIVYGLHTPYLSAANYIKRINKNAKTILICPDLAEYMDPSISKKKLKQILRRIEAILIQKTTSVVDGAVLFAPSMQEALPLDVPCTTIEGVYFENNIDSQDDPSYEKTDKTVLYAGSLNSNFGIQNIIKAVQLLDDKSITLSIFGTGELEHYIKNIASQDPRIRFHGFVERGKLFEYEKQAGLLINARDPNEAFTRYSFPSKMIEYMVSGTPVMTTHLAGIPSDYDAHLFYIEDNSPETIKTQIERYFGMTEDHRKQFGQSAKRFIQENKNKYQQAKKLNGLLQELVNGL